MKFEEELARRNPDWKKIVVCYNDAIAKLEKQLAAERELRESDGGISFETKRKLAAERERSK
jgi:hypothetical protein